MNKNIEKLLYNKDIIVLTLVPHTPMPTPVIPIPRAPYDIPTRTPEKIIPLIRTPLDKPVDIRTPLIDTDTMYKMKGQGLRNLDNGLYAMYAREEQKRRELGK